MEAVSIKPSLINVPILVLDIDQFSKVKKGVPIERIANDEYFKQAEESNKKVQLKIYEYECEDAKRLLEEKVKLCED